jgi:hypothetical protein
MEALSSGFPINKPTESNPHKWRERTASRERRFSPEPRNLCDYTLLFEKSSDDEASNKKNWITATTAEWVVTGLKTGSQIRETW